MLSLILGVPKKASKPFEVMSNVLIKSNACDFYLRNRFILPNLILVQDYTYENLT